MMSPTFQTKMPEFQRNSPHCRNVCASSRLGFSVKHLCVGESYEERRKGIELDFAVGQVHDVTRDLSDEEAAKLIVAYEPVWAIGTGMVATPQSAQDAARAIRNDLSDTFGTRVGETVRILYGGSVSSKNAVELINEPDVDGFLIGGSALKVDELTRICKLTLETTA